MRKGLMVISIISACLLTGCKQTESFVNEITEEQIMSASEIANDENYMQYKQLEEEGKLSETGEYKEALIEPHKQVHVTFAANSFIEVSYYYDKDLTKKVDENACYLDPSETLYAKTPICNNPNSDDYSFSGFRVYEYDKDGKRGKKAYHTSSGKAEVLEIPKDYTGTELSIEVIGHYK